jgi:hypothetical protein
MCEMNKRQNSFSVIAVFAILVFVFYSPFPMTIAVVFGYGGGGGTNYFPSPSKTITAFSITGQIGQTIIDQNAKTIVLTMPYGTDVASLAPTIAIAGISVSPDSGAANDFTASRTYTVTAADGSTQDYAVTVNVAPAANQVPAKTGDAGRATDIIRDGKIDLLDFNALMVDWGRSGPKERADVNYDGVVDLLDFNLVMVYWGQEGIL